MPTTIYDSSLITQRKRDKTISGSFINRIQNPVNPTTGSAPYLGITEQSIINTVKNGQMTDYRKNDGGCTIISPGCPCGGNFEPIIPPGIIANVQYSYGSLIISWTQPSGTPPFTYTVTLTLVGTSTTIVGTTTNTTFTFADNLFTPYADYYISVFATNGGGSGAPTFYTGGGQTPLAVKAPGPFPPITSTNIGETFIQINYPNFVVPFLITGAVANPPLPAGWTLNANATTITLGRSNAVNPAGFVNTTFRLTAAGVSTSASAPLTLSTTGFTPSVSQGSGTASYAVFNTNFPVASQGGIDVTSAIIDPTTPLPSGWTVQTVGANNNGFIVDWNGVGSSEISGPFRFILQGGGVSSLPSNNISTITALGAPTALAATGGNGDLTISFTAAPTPPGATITNYDYSLDNGSTFTSFSPAQTTSPVVISSLNNGTTYQVKLRTRAGVEFSLPSATVSGTPDVAPGAPTGVIATPGGNGALSVTFTAGLNSGSAITNYQYSTDNGSTFTSFSPAQTTSPLTISGLTNNQAYNVQIKAVNTLASLASNTYYGVAGFGASIGGNTNPAAQYIQYPNDAGLTLGTQNFTIEWYQYWKGQESNPSGPGGQSGGTCRVFSIGTAGQPAPSTMGIQLIYSITALNVTSVLYRNSANNAESTYNFTTAGPNGVPTQDAWVHMALVRNGATMTLYQNGAVYGTPLNIGSISIANNTSVPLTIGNQGIAGLGDQYNGFITNFRWVTGTAIYTGPFTPPALPLTPVTGTQLLLMAAPSQSFTDSSPVARAISANFYWDPDNSSPF